MAPKNKPYEQFGPYILFKKFEAEALSDLWRAGRIDGNAVAQTVALRRFTGGNRDALLAAAGEAAKIVPMLQGTSFAKNQVIGVIDGVPFIAHDYAGGRSLRHIVDRARGGTGATPNPIPIDQAIAIAERVALSVATLSDLRYDGNRLVHGALIPQLIWISDDGEIRVAGQGLGRGIVASLKDPRVAAEVGRYFAPELANGAAPSRSSDVYSLGAILYLLVTGIEPPDAFGSAFAQSIRAAKLPAGQPVPDDIRAILEKSLVVDASFRYGSVADMKQALSALVHGGKYSATTFNLAFYLSNLLKKEMESEAIDRDREAKVNVAPYLEPAAAPPPAAAPMFGSAAAEPKKSRAPLAIAAVVVLVAIGAGAWYFLSSKSAKPAAPVPTPKPVVAAKPVPPPVVSTPVVSTPVGTTTVDPAAQKKAFEDAVNAKLQAEMMKLQTDYTKKLQQTQSKNAPVATQAQTVPASVATSQPEDRISAAALDERRLQAERTQPTPQQPAPAVQPQTATQTAQRQPQPQVAQPTAPASAVHEGDVIDISQLDSVPRPLTPIRPSYPPIARRQRIEGAIFLTALISETGAVVDVRILGGEQRMGLGDAAVRALREARFSPGIKDGKRVKTWFPQTIVFKL